jgi:hypothetical protein
LAVGPITGDVLAGTPTAAEVATIGGGGFFLGVLLAVLGFLLGKRSQRQAMKAGWDLHDMGDRRP